MLVYIGLQKFGWKFTLVTSLSLSLLFFITMVVLDVIILLLKNTGIVNKFIIDEQSQRLQSSRLFQVDMTIMIIFVIAFPALATVMVTLVLSDLSSLKNSISTLLTN